MIPLLSGLRIVDVTAIILGPYATQILGDLGAEVIKVEPIGGDSMRAIHPIATPGISALFVNNNRNKRSLAIDLKSEAGKEIVRKLLATSDALVHNMRQDAFDRLGFGVKAVRALNPKLVYCAAVGFGSNGPYAGRPAYDDVIQAMSGFAGLFGLRDGTPALAPSIVADKVVGLHVVYAVLAALLHRERNGGNGLAIEVPMFESMTAFTMNEHLDRASFEAGGKFGYARALTPQRRPYRTADGWIAALPYTFPHWQRTLTAIGETEIAGATWLRDDGERNLRAPELYQILERALAKRSTATWLALFEQLDVPCGKVNMPADLPADPHLQAVGMFDADFDGPTPVIRTLNQPVRMPDLPRAADAVPPPLGEANGELLGELGYSLDEIDGLMRSGAVRLPS